MKSAAPRGIEVYLVKDNQKKYRVRIPVGHVKIFALAAKKTDIRPRIVPINSTKLIGSSKTVKKVSLTSKNTERLERSGM